MYKLLRRELAEMLIRDELRDPRLKPNSSLSITAVSVSPDLSHARVFIDTLSPEIDAERVLAGFRSSASSIRRKVASRVHLKHIPRLHFEYDESVARGRRIEEILSEIREGHGNEDEADTADSALESAEKKSPKDPLGEES